MQRALLTLLLLCVATAPALALLDDAEIAALKAIRDGHPSLASASYYTWNDANIQNACSGSYSYPTPTGVSCGYAPGDNTRQHVLGLTISSSYPKTGMINANISGLIYCKTLQVGLSSSSTTLDISDYTLMGNVTSFTYTYASYSGTPPRLSAAVSNWTKLTDLSLTYYYGVDLPNLTLPALSKFSMTSYYGYYYSYVSPNSGNSPFSSTFFAGVPALTQLTVVGIGMTEIPDLSGLTQLKVLDLSSNGLKTLPDSFSTCSLTSLKVPNNYAFTKFPASLSNCVNLTYVDASSTGLASSDSLFDMRNTQVNYLYLNYAKYTTLPDAICQLSLRPLTNISLSMAGMALTSIPACFANNIYLYGIYTTNTNFTEFPTVITSLPALALLQMQYNQQPIYASSMPDFSVMKNLYQIDLSNFGVVGPFPLSLRNCPKLTYLQLNGNQFTGTLPDDFFEGTLIYAFFVTGSRLSGPMPSSAWKRVQYFIAPGNRFTSIPSLIGASKVMYSLDLSDNQLTGVLTNAQFANMSYLSNLQIGGNQLSGPLPTFWASQPSNLATGNFSFNAFTGGVPSLNTSTLYDIYIGNNALDGNFATVVKAPYLRTFSAPNGGLKGTIPNSIGAPTTGALAMTTFDISNNEMTGTLPPQFGSLTALSTIRINNNGFSGNLPNLSGFRSLSRFYAQFNFFSLCAVNPGFYSISKSNCNLTNELFPNACDCPAFYSSCTVDTSCPAPDYVAPPETPIGPAPTPIKPPTVPPVEDTSSPSASVDPNAPVAPSAPTDSSTTPSGDSSTLAYSVALFFTALIATLLA